MNFKQLLYIIGIGLVLSVFMACGGKNSNNPSIIPDKTVYTQADSLVVKAGQANDFDRAIFLADSLFDAGELSLIRANDYKGIAYISMGQMQNGLECFRRACADENPPAEDFWEYISAGCSIAHLQNVRQDLDGAIRTALYFIDKLKHIDSPTRAGNLHNLYYCLGNTQMKLDRHEESAKSFNEAYHWLKTCIDNDSTGIELKGALTTLENIAIAQLNIEQFDEAEKWINREDSLLAIYKKCSVSDSADVAFYHALITLNRAQICQARGQKEEAARYYDEYAAGEYGKSAEGRISGCAYLMPAHRYTEAAYNFTYLNEFIHDRDIEFDLETIGGDLLPKFRSNYFAGKKDSALQVAVQIAEVYDSALVRQRRSEAAELATIYDTQGKEQQIAEHEARNRVFMVVIIAIAIVTLLVVGFAVYIFRQWRITQRRNRILAQQISDAVEYKEKLREQKKIQSTTEEKTTRAELSISDYTTLDDEQLFLFLRDLIENEKLFLQPDFGRQTLIEHTGLSKERIGAAFSQGSDSSSLPAYVRELRLDHAIRLMNEQSDMAVELVSQASGFTSADTFTRNFRTKYGMTPTVYKQTKNHL